MKEIWFNWKFNWEWVSQIATKRDWRHLELIIKPPVNLMQINDLELEMNITFPKDFKDVLTQFSSAVDLRWYFENEETEEGLENVYFGGENLWNFEDLKDIYEAYKGWKEIAEEFEDEHVNLWQNKVPFMSLPNGDIIAFDDFTNNVIYLSHDGHEFHGKKLANSFTDFISKWSELGCPGPECWILTHFYNYEMNEIDPNVSRALKWRKWLENLNYVQ